MEQEMHVEAEMVEEAMQSKGSSSDEAKKA